MAEKFERLIKMCRKGIPLKEDNVGEGMFLVDRGTFQLVIPLDNSENHGDFFVHSTLGHDCYSYNRVSTHTYHIIDGSGTFIIEKDETETRIETEKGSTITIEPGTIFTYIGNMIMTFEMEPNYKVENDIRVKEVNYGPSLKKISKIIPSKSNYRR